MGRQPGRQPAAQGPGSHQCLVAAQQEENLLTLGQGVRGCWGPGGDRLCLPRTVCASLCSSQGSCLPSRKIVTLNLVLPFKRLP